MQGISQVSRAWLDLCFSAPGQTAAWLSKCFLLQRGCLSTQYSAFAWVLPAFSTCPFPGLCLWGPHIELQGCAVPAVAGPAAGFWQ